MGGSESKQESTGKQQVPVKKEASIMSDSSLSAFTSVKDGKNPPSRSYLATAAASAKSRDEINRLRTIDFGGISERCIMKGEYFARVIDLYDADTLTVALFNESGKLESLEIRVYGMDAPELKSKTSEAGKNEALKYIGAEGCIGKKLNAQTVMYFKENVCIIRVCFVQEKEKWGRYLAHIYAAGKTRSLSEHLIDLGHADPYDGGKKDQSKYENQ